MKQGDALVDKSKKALLELAICAHRQHDTETKHTLTTILTEIGGLERRLNIQLRALGDSMADVTKTVTDKSNALLQAITDLGKRIDAKVQDDGDSMDATEAAPIYASLDKMKDLVNGMFPADPGQPAPQSTDSAEPTTAEAV